MSTTTAAESDKRVAVRPKTYTYRTGLEWTGGRSGTMRSESKPDVPVSSPPEFKGEPGVWTPEDLFVSAVEICTMTTFLAFAERSKIPLISYRSQAEGRLELVDRQFAFTQVVVRPEIVVGDSEAVAAARDVLDKAHQRCLIANSIRCAVVVDAGFSVQRT